MARRLRRIPAVSAGELLQHGAASKSIPVQLELEKARLGGSAGGGLIQSLVAAGAGSLNFLFPTSSKLEMFASAAVVRHALIMPAGVVSPSSALGPSTLRITTARSRNACAPLP